MPTWWSDIEFANLNVIELQPCRARAPDRLRCGAGIGSREMVRMVQAKGAGYAMSKQQELETMQCVAHATGALWVIRCSQLMIIIHAAKCCGDTRLHKKPAGDKSHVRAGVILDPVYSGKAYHTLMDEMKQQPEQWTGRKVLFLHTGGLFGMYDKVSQLQPMLQKMNTADRMVVS